MKRKSNYKSTISKYRLLFLLLMILSTTSYAQRIYVNENATGLNNGRSWQDAYVSLQSALARAFFNDDIWIAEGTYRPSEIGDRTASFRLKNGISIYGGFPNTDSPTLNDRDCNKYLTILDGNIGDPTLDTDNSYHVVISNNTDRTTSLHCITITNGYADGISPHDSGGGILNENGSPYLSGITIQNNYAIFGGGMKNSNRSQPNLNSIHFKNNKAEFGGALNNETSNPELRLVSFTENFAHLAGGGIFNEKNATLTLKNITFRGNESAGKGGAMANLTSTVEINQALLTGNRATDFAGAIYNDASTVTINSATMSGNFANSQANVLGNENNAQVEINNSIIWENETSALAIVDDATSQTTIAYSTVEGGWNTVNSHHIIDQNPLFIAPINVINAPTIAGNFHIKLGSPTIDAGNKTLSSSITLDFDGKPRIQGSHIDMGVFEIGQTNCNAVREIPKTECQTLVNIYKNTQGHHWTDFASNNWNITNTPCSWTGVTCQINHVVSIDRQNQNLTRQLPDLTHLINLTTFSANNNQLTGQLPTFPSTIENIDLGFNQLQGNIPTLNLPHLKNLDLQNNQFSGDFPDLSQVPQLLNFNFAENKIVGEMSYLPHSTGTMDVSYNGLMTKNADWLKTQTVPPTHIHATDITTTSMTLNWTPITYTQDGGYYKIHYGTTAGTYTQSATTTDKLANTMTLTNLLPDTTYYIAIQTYTPVHDTQQNAIYSNKATYSVSTLALPVIPVTPTPEPIPEPSPEPTPSPSQPISYNNGFIYPTPSTGEVTGTTINTGKTATDIHIKPNSSLSGGYLSGNIINEGLVANVIIDEDANMTGGGKLTGYSTNQGEIDDIIIPSYSQITNEGIIKNVTIGEKANVRSGILGGRVTNYGLLCGVYFAPDAQVVGGHLDCDIDGDEQQPAQVGAAILAEDTDVCNVRLSPTVQFEQGVTLCSNVRLPEDPTYPILEDFGIDIDEIDAFTPERIRQLEPAAFSIFSAENTARMPPNAFSALTQQQLSQFTVEGLQGLTIAQFDQLAIETLSGFTKDNLAGIPTDVIHHLTGENITAIGDDTLMNTPALAKLCTNMDANKISLNEVQTWLPKDWEIDLVTGDIIPATGAKLGYKALEMKAPEQVTLPNYQPDFNTGMGFAGKTSKNTVLKDLNEALKIAGINAIFEQKQNGVLEMVGKGELAGYTFTFMPDVDDMKQVDINEKAGIYLDKNHRYVAITTSHQKFTMINAPRDPIDLFKVLGTNSQVILGKKGDVRLQFQNNTRDNETVIHVVAVFDPFIEPPPQEFCNFQLGQSTCNWDAMASYQQPGIHFPVNDRKRQEARIVYEDGSAQTIYATVVKPDIFIETGLKLKGITDINYHSDGSFDIVYQGEHLKLYPTFNPTVSEVEKGMRVKPNIEINPEGSLTYTVQDKQQLIQSHLLISIE